MTNGIEFEKEEEFMKSMGDGKFKHVDLQPAGLQNYPGFYWSEGQYAGSRNFSRSPYWSNSGSEYRRPHTISDGAQTSITSTSIDSAIELVPRSERRVGSHTDIDRERLPVIHNPSYHGQGHVRGHSASSYYSEDWRYGQEYPTSSYDPSYQGQSYGQYRGGIYSPFYPHRGY